jgi:gliding motility-associated-like protein
MKKIHLYLLAVNFILIFGNSINSSAQTPAVQTAKKTSGGTGYLEHLPPDYSTNTTKKYPVMFFLHGLGERGSGSPADLEKLKAGGPPKEMKNGHNMCFTVNGVEECFIVISPQLGTSFGGWWGGTLQGVFDYVMKGPENYRIDPNRVYLTGLSLGGNGVYTGLGATSDIFAAAAVIAGYDNGYGCTISGRKIAVWGFHGESDTTIPYTVGYANFQSITNCTSPVPTAEYKWVSYPGVGHNSWDRAFKPDHTYHNPNLYEWLLTKSKSSFPTANAGADKAITLPTNTITITGSGIDSDGTVVGYSWQKTSGGTATITNGNTPTATFSNLAQGIYTFRLTVTDNSGNSSFDDVNVTVNPATVNVAPVITLATTLSLTLPTNSSNIVAVVSDTDGFVASYLWTQQSGPSTATLGGTTTATLSASALVAGTYVFRLTATDNETASSYKEISVVVNPLAANQVPVASAGLDKIINLPTNSTNLAGSGTDADGTIVSYLWEKTAGPAATLTNTTSSTLVVTNLVAGLYTFRLTVTDNKGATGTDDVNVTVVASNQSPTANAGADLAITLPTNSTSISGAGSDIDGSIASYAWVQVSGPSTSTLANATNATLSVSNLIQGAYIYRLTVTDNLGATGIDEVKVTVNALPVNNSPIANAGSDQLVALPVNSTILNGSGTDSDGTIASYSWIKLSGPTVTLLNANTASLTLNELIPGSYSFQLTVTDNKGATGTDLVVVTVQSAVVNQIPTVFAGPDKGLILPNNTVTLYGGGYDADGTITFAWTKQSGPATYTFTNQNTNNVTLSNLVAGVYVFRITVTDDKGATNFDEATVTVSLSNTAPVANAGPDIIINLPTNSVSIAGAGTDADGTISNYQWTTVSGPSTPTLTNATTSTLSVSGLIAGTYNFRLMVTDNVGASGWDEVKVTVNAANQIPVANAGGNRLLTLPTTTINLTGSGVDNDGTIVSYAWTQISGPGATLTNANNATVSITVFSSNTYVFRLTVTDNSGDSDYNEMTLTVNAATVNQPPSAYAGVNQTIALPVNATVLTGSGSDPDGSIASYLWIKVSGPSATLQNETTPSVSLSNLLQATYVFRLTVTDNGGLTAFSDVTVNVLPETVNQAPTASAGVDQILTLPVNSTTVFGSGSDPDGTIQSYKWEKLSGPAASLLNETTPTLSLTDLIEGTYVFRLTVGDNNSSSGSDDVVITVNAAGVNQLPVANAGPDQAVNLPTSSATIEGTGSDPDGTIVSYLWSKLSGPTGVLLNTTNATLTVASLIEGTYTFRLTVTDNDGATSTDDVLLQVLSASINQSPVVSAGTPVSLVLPENSTKLTGTAFDPDGTIASYVWTKVSGGNATMEDATTPALSLTNLQEGNYVFRLTATDDKGAIGSAVVDVEVKAAGTNVAPIADAGADVSIKLPINTVTLTGSGSDADGTIAGYLWEKLSGPAATLANATTASLLVSAMTEGSYSFQLTVTDNDGLKATDEVKVVVLPQTFNLAPVASAGADVSLTLPENSVVLQGSGTDSDGSIASYLWTKVSGPSSASESGNATANLSLTSLVVGTYIYRLIVTDNSGSASSDEVAVRVSPNPESLIDQDPPIANAGPDQLLSLGTKTTRLIGTFEDKVIVNKFFWKQISGESSLLAGADTDTLNVDGLAKGTYVFELTVTNIHGKSGSDEVTVTIGDEIIVDYKKFFSPNGDGQNDFWELDPDISKLATCKLIIFDSKGNRLLTTEGYQNNWDGNFNGKPLPEEAYYFVLECGGKRKSGSVTLIR